MKSTIQLTATTDALPEANAWLQPREEPATNIDFNARVFKSRIERTLVAEEYNRKHAETAPLPEAEGTKSTKNRTRGIIRQINSAVVSAFPRIAPPPAISLQPLQEWEGYVTSIGEDTFTGHLVDVTARQRTEQEAADFPISDLSDDDRKLLEVGAVFRWVIGYQRSSGGTKRRVSQVTFRRMPAWSRRDLIEANKVAVTLSKEIRWE
jgi:hypothetical protein